jgi:16S rRNA (uracil1498-N3)-methyltransferase
MPAERYFFEGDLSLSQHLLLTDQEFHHLAHVMRLRDGEGVEIVNGHGLLAMAKILKIEKKQATLEVTHLLEEPPPKFEVILAQAIPRINRFDFILEKGTELGMTQIWIYPGEYSERKQLNQHQLERSKAILIAAMKQCGRLWLPEIVIKPPLLEWQENINFSAYFGDVSPNAPSFAPLWAQEKDRKRDVIFFIGPEKGFNEKEENYLKKLGATGVKLHKNILRTDTAPLVALSLVTTL